MDPSKLPEPEGAVKHGLTGSHVHFACPACGEHLHNPLSDAGRRDRCPQCGAAYIVPCAAERRRIEEERAREAEQRHRVEAAAAKRKQAAIVAVSETKGERKQEGRKDRRGDEPPGVFRIVGAVMVCVSILIAADAIVSNQDNIVSTGDLGLAIGNAAFFVGGILFYTLGTLLRALYQIRDRSMD